MKEQVLLIQAGAQIFTIYDRSFKITSAFIRRGGNDYQLQVADLAQFHKIRPIPKGLGSVIYLDSCGPDHCFDCILVEDTELHLIDNEGDGSDSLWHYVPERDVKFGRTLRVRLPNTFEDRNPLPSLDALKYKELCSEISSLRLQVLDLQRRLATEVSLVAELNLRLNPPAKAPAPFPTIQHDKGPWR